MDIEEINSDRDKFLSQYFTSVEAELKKVGLKLINVNITDIHDESGYIEALGKEAAAKAINDAENLLPKRTEMDLLVKQMPFKMNEFKLLLQMHKPLKVKILQKFKLQILIPDRRSTRSRS